MAVSGGGALPEGASRERSSVAPGPAEERYRALIRSFPKSAVLLFDHELRFVVVDGPEVHAVGYSKEKMEGRTAYEVLPPVFLSLVEPNMRRVLGGEEFSAELPYDRFYHLYSYVPIRDDDGKVVYGLVVATNITERRAVEEALRKSEERFLKIFHVAPDPVGVTRAIDGVLVEVNPAFVEVFGWTRAEAIGKSTLDLDIWVERGQRKAVIDAVQARGRIEHLEMTARRKNGDIVEGLVSFTSVELDGESCVFFSFRDQTERVRALRALEASEARLRSLADATFEGIAITQRGDILDVNDQIVDMLQRKREELVGQSVLSVVAPESLSLVRDKLAERGDEVYEHLAIRADGTRFPVEVRGRHAQIQGVPVRVTAIRDITQRKKDEAERDRLIAELRARNSEMEQFAYTVSHDLKSPLVTINGFLGVLERDIADGDAERIGSDIARIGSAATKMMRLLNDVLEVSRIGRVAQTNEPVALQEVAMEALELVSGAIAARRANVVVADALPVVMGNRVRLLEVVQNLLENALKYMGNQPEPRIEIGAREDPTHSVLFIRDNGIGIKQVHAERIFGLFEKLDPKSEGTGVGLALVRRILEYHGGSISVESDGVTGSTFVLQFPEASSTMSASSTRREAR
ncbi:MAG TPA: PAS domain S-box protein [Polyangiaceae bacterium]|nr:PAS domain S-box protein [Polyangiaceae bacterium]